MNNLFNEISSMIGTYIPNILGALAILIIGWIVASLVAMGIKELLKRTSIDNKLAAKLTGEDGKKPFEIETWISKGVFWLIMAFVLVAFFEALNLTIITEPLNKLLTRIFSYAPQILGAGILFLVAWLLATIVQKLITVSLQATKIDEKISEKSGEKEKKAVPLSKTLGDIAYWLVFLLFLPAILGALNLGGILQPVQNMLDKILEFLPNVLTAGIILLIGWFVAKIIRQIVTGLLSAVGTDNLSEKVGLSSVLGDKNLSGLIGLVVYILILIPIVIAALNTLNLDAITHPASNMLNQTLDAIPKIFAAAIILIISYVIAKIIAGFVENLLSGLGFDKIFVQLGVTKEVSEDAKSPSKLVGYIVLVAMMLFAFTEAFDTLGFEMLSKLVAEFTVLGGHILLGLVIFMLGLFFANLASEAVKSSGVANAGFLATVTRIAILVFAGAMGLRYMGLANEIIVIAFSFLLGSIAVAAAIAFGIGGKDLAAKKLEEWNKKVD